jgi:hypothetical protein
VGSNILRWPLLSSARGVSCVAASATLQASLQGSDHIDDKPAASAGFDVRVTQWSPQMFQHGQNDF